MRHFPVLCLLVAVGCGSATTPPSDGGVEAGAVDGLRAPPDAGAPALAVNFSVRGCARLDFGAGRCEGRAPLALEFIPISTAGIGKYLWDFGDGAAKSSELTPSHVYTLPGAYDVTLVAGGAGGTVSSTRVGFVVVVPNQTSEPCDVEAQCQAGLGCVCGSAARCSAAFARGLCSRGCESQACEADEICADLGLGRPVGNPAGEQWQRPLCLRRCTADRDCAVGLRCRELPAREPGGRWQRACLPDVPGGTGAPCRGPGGELQDSACLGGHCADLGAHGSCAASCGPGLACPAATSCVTLNDGRRLCLPICGPAFACDGDPLLSCVAANPGSLGFTAPEGGPQGAAYCAPKPCTRNESCGPAGLCQGESSGAHCVRRTSP